jgi:hypothetical protein
MTFCSAFYNKKRPVDTHLWVVYPIPMGTHLVGNDQITSRHFDKDRQGSP